MNPDDIIKAAPAIAKVAGPLAAAIPFTAIVKRMLGPAADELAEMWRDQVRLYRYERQVKCVEKAERMAQEAGFTPQAVPPKILFPLLEGASFEDNEDLHTMWAALLANAASSENAGRVRPAFIAILKQMSPDEAVLLKWFYSVHEFAKDIPKEEVTRAYFSHGFGVTWDGHNMIDVGSFETCSAGLEAERLIDRRRSDHADDDDSANPYLLTFRGDEFVKACQPPQPKPES